MECNEFSQAGQAVGHGNPVKDVCIETDAQLPGGFGQGHEGIPGGDAVRGTGAEADIPFAHPLTYAQFGRVVVQGRWG